MRSYFSQLAKQSGLPTAVSGKKTHSLAKSSEDIKIKPLHKEKTILTSSSAIDMDNKKSLDNFPKSEQKQTAINNSSKIKSENQKPQKNSESEKPTSENPYKSEINAEKEKEIKYFEKTTRILEENKSSPQEVQQIFLNEIQQWVADSPELKEGNKEPETEKINTVKLSPPQIIETSGLRETSETIEKDSDFSETEPAEQHLSLSIGTISIVIEDSEENVRAVEDLTNKNSAKNEVAKVERKFSRLSRRYL